MRVEDKVVRLSKEDILALEAIILDGDKEQAYKFIKKIRGYIETQEKGVCKPIIGNQYG